MGRRRFREDWLTRGPQDFNETVFSAGTKWGYQIINNWLNPSFNWLNMLWKGHTSVWTMVMMYKHKFINQASTEWLIDLKHADEVTLLQFFMETGLIQIHGFSYSELPYHAKMKVWNIVSSIKAFFENSID